MNANSLTDSGPVRHYSGYWAVAVLLTVSACMSGPSIGSRPLIHIDTGELSGVRLGKVIAFKGIPYAQAPVGELRWHAPQALPSWPGIREAQQYGNLCMQKFNVSDNGVGPLPMSEDCLTLNVWTTNTNTTARLPVMLWIHGGGFVNGSGTAALYDGQALAQRGVVVVTINYRLGRFGFFAHPLLSAETKTSSHSYLGNYGLMDQIAALQWIQRNITAFGGDPGKVTLFGESAGASSVNLLMVSPKATGLFQRAIAESAVGRLPLPPLSQTIANSLKLVSNLPFAETMGEQFIATLNATARTTEDLRAIPAERIIAAEDPSYADGQAPMLDGQLLTQDIDAAFASGQQARVPYLLGINALEFPWFTAQKPSKFAGLLAGLKLNNLSVTSAYGDDTTFNERLISDLLFTEPARFYAEQHARLGIPTYLYRFSVLSPAAQAQFKATPHAQERQYVFGTLSASPWPTVPADTTVADLMMDYWVNFARTGNPNDRTNMQWPRYANQNQAILEFTDDGAKVSSLPFKAALDELEAIR